MGDIRDKIGLIATDIWERIELSEYFKTFQSEETLTENKILQILKFCKENGLRYKLRVRQTTKKEESITGVDYTIIIKKGDLYAIIAVQAKKLDILSEKYKQLNHKTPKKYKQVEIFDDYLKKNKEILGFYSFYNLLQQKTLSGLSNKWNCPNLFTDKEWGWTFVKQESIKSRYGQNKRFKSLKFGEFHKDKNGIPARCFFCKIFGNKEEQTEVFGKKIEFNENSELDNLFQNKDEKVSFFDNSESKIWSDSKFVLLLDIDESIPFEIDKCKL